MGASILLDLILILIQSSLGSNMLGMVVQGPALEADEKRKERERLGKCQRRQVDPEQ